MEHDYALKFIIVGDTGTGKTNLMYRFVFDKFTSEIHPTIGIEFGTKTHQIDNFIVKIYVWDTAGQEKFMSITKAYYRASHCVFIVYDISDQKSYDHVVNIWHPQACELTDSNTLKVLVANKSDLKSVVDINIAKKFAENNGMFFFEVSPLMDVEKEALNNMFISMAKNCVMKIENGRENGREINTHVPKQCDIQLHPQQHESCFGCF